MEESSWSIVLAEFVHVGGALIIIIAVVSVLTGIMREYVPQDKIQKKLVKHENRGSLVGALLGTLTPFCSASMVPVVMGMAEMGVSMATIFGFLISAPLCNFVVVGLILAIFGWKVALIYFALTFGGAVLSGYVIGHTPLRNAIKRNLAPPATPVCDAAPAVSSCAPVKTSCCAVARQEFETILYEDELELGLMPPLQTASAGCEALLPVPMNTGCGATQRPSGIGCSAPTQAEEGTAHAVRLRQAMAFAWVLFKRIIPYVLLGTVISALSAAFLPGEMVEKYVGGDNWYAIPVAAGIGVPLYLRIEMAIPLLNVLIAKGMGMGAAMALLIGGTGASLPEIALISAVLKPKAVIAFVATVFTIAVTSGVIFSVI